MSAARSSNWSWEQAVEWLRNQPDQATLVRDCYFDDPLVDAAERFLQGDEWQGVRELLPDCPGRALDLGAGRGIGSYALSREGWRVTAAEPDGSGLVGTGAIRELAAREAGIAVARERAEELSFRDGSFDLVYGRQVLHHATDLRALCREVYRVLRPGGRFLATREHVISRPQDLTIFLEAHPLHGLFGGESAYLLGDYLTALGSSGFSVKRVLGPFDSVLNYWPMSRDEWWATCTRPVRRFLGDDATRILASERRAAGRWLLRTLARWRSVRNQTPGRLYSFVAERPR